MQPTHRDPVISIASKGRTGTGAGFQALIGEFGWSEFRSSYVYRGLVQSTRASAPLTAEQVKLLVGQLHTKKLTGEQLAKFTYTVSPSSVAAVALMRLEAEVQRLTPLFRPDRAKSTVDGVDMVQLQADIIAEAPFLAQILTGLINPDGKRQWRGRLDDDDPRDWGVDSSLLQNIVTSVIHLMSQRSKQNSRYPRKISACLKLNGVGTTAWTLLQQLGVVCSQTTVRTYLQELVDQRSDEISSMLRTRVDGKRLWLPAVVTDNLDVAVHGTVRHLMTTTVSTIPGPAHPVFQEMETFIKEHFERPPETMNPRSLLRTSLELRAWIDAALDEVALESLTTVASVQAFIASIKLDAFIPKVKGLIEVLQAQRHLGLPINDKDEKLYTDVWKHLEYILEHLGKLDPSLLAATIRTRAKADFPAQTETKQRWRCEKHRRAGGDGQPECIPDHIMVDGRAVCPLSGDFMTCDRCIGCASGQAFDESNQFSSLDCVAGLLHESLALGHAVLKLANTPEQGQHPATFSSFLQHIGKTDLLTATGAKRHREVVACIKAFHAQIELACLVYANPGFEADPASPELSLKDDLRSAEQQAVDDATAGGDANQKKELAAASNQRILLDAFKEMRTKTSRTADVCLSDKSFESLRRAKATLQDPVQTAQTPKSPEYHAALKEVSEYTRVMAERDQLPSVGEYWCWVKFSMELLLAHEKATRCGAHHISTALNKVSSCFVGAASADSHILCSFSQCTSV